MQNQLSKKFQKDFDLFIKDFKNFLLSTEFKEDRSLVKDLSRLIKDLEIIEPTADLIELKKELLFLKEEGVISKENKDELFLYIDRIHDKIINFTTHGFYKE